ncbi:hypothetical protein Tco_0844720 [Tanacetum coccineum]
MASGGSDRDAEDALSKLLQMGTVAEYQNEFEMLINRVTGISESLLTSFYISGLKLTIQIELFRARPTTLGEAFSLAHIIEARFEAIVEVEKECIITKKVDTIISLQSELASPEIKWSLDADEDIGVDEVSSAIDCVFHIGESNEVCSKKSRGAAEGVVGVAGHQNNDEPDVLKGNGVIGVGVNENNKGDDKEVQYLVYALHVLIPLLKCLNDKYIKKKKMEAVIQKRIWNPRIKSVFQDNTLRAR